jgi:hypothetical protein
MRATRGRVEFPYTNPRPHELLKATAYHESGHVAVAYRYGKLIREAVSISTETPGDGNSGIRGELLIPHESHCDMSPALLHAQELRLRSECMEFLAGYAAEFRAMRVRGSPLIASADVHRAIGLIRHFRGCDESRAMLELQFYHLDVKSLIWRRAIWSAISELAGALLRAHDGKLDSDEAEAVLKRSGLRPVRHSYWGKMSGRPDSDQG